HRPLFSFRLRNWTCHRSLFYSSSEIGPAACLWLLWTDVAVGRGPCPLAALVEGPGRPLQSKLRSAPAISTSYAIMFAPVRADRALTGLAGSSLGVRTLPIRPQSGGDGSWLAGNVGHKEDELHGRGALTD